MTSALPPEARRPPPPDASPGGRFATPVRDPVQAVVRVTQPELMRRAQLERTRGRLVWAAFGFSLLFGAVAFKLALATVLAPVDSRRVVAASRPPPAVAQAPVLRGTVTDRNGEILAVSLPINALYANPREIDNPARVADQLRRVLPQLDRERLIARLSGERQFAYLARALTPREVQAVNDLGIPGLHFEDAERRYFPQGRNAVHVIGGTDVDGQGIAGVERFFDERLRGDLRNTPLRLSVDVRVQLAMRDAVQRAITDFNGIGGAGIVMDVTSGEVLAMVSLPDYDANDVGAATVDQRFNRVTVGVYEPGSTFKLFTAAMALDLGVIQPWNGFDASRPIRYGRFTISDYRGRNRWLSLPEILTNSSNIGAAHMAMAVGPPRHREFLSRLHMGQRLRIELAETAMPLFPSQPHWRDINTMTIGFGHGVSVTPMHVVTGVSALVNGGTWREPTLVAQAQGAPPREGTRVVSERTSELMRRLMRLVVTDGSGRSAEVTGYFLGGKTGTAQKTGPRGGYLRDKRIAAFVGAFPMNAPRYALYVMVDEPKPNAQSHGFATAGWVAAPAANYVVSRIAPILGLLPETERAAEIQASIAMPLNGRITLPGPRPNSTPTAAPPARSAPAAAPTRPAMTTPAQPAGPLRQAMAREADLAPR
ncbi:penicillin-binding protein 2 [Roseomonas hellenica]|uniref:Penicillin-binding protein 2 n=1 Tax=Plastoroseomonas hellenica TaxID=2687306 RepID=A0ABS5F9F0_9PROT|nr:penicillin-binding protein 2 [Plastoroseomonas hellenica]MBR0669193.1 penicillin-binding protein 2 [Plastoroseomonas hellenica]